MVTIEFTKEFANRKKGDTFECDNMLATRLVNVRKVAKFVKKKATKDDLL